MVGCQPPGYAPSMSRMLSASNEGPNNAEQLTCGPDNDMACGLEALRRAGLCFF